MSSGSCGLPGEPAGVADLQRHVQQQGQIRARVADGEIDDWPDHGQIELAAVTLVGGGRIVETVAQDDLTGGEGRADDLADELGAAGVHQQQSASGRHGRVPWLCLSVWRISSPMGVPPGSRSVRTACPVAQPLGQQPDLRVLPPPSVPSNVMKSPFMSRSWRHRPGDIGVGLMPGCRGGEEASRAPRPVREGCSRMKPFTSESIWASVSGPPSFRAKPGITEPSTPEVTRCLHAAGVDEAGAPSGPEPGRSDGRPRGKWRTPRHKARVPPACGRLGVALGAMPPEHRLPVAQRGLQIAEPVDLGHGRGGGRPRRVGAGPFGAHHQRLDAGGPHFHALDDWAGAASKVQVDPQGA